MSIVDFIAVVSFGITCFCAGYTFGKALHEDERFLSSVNLLGKFSTVEARDDMLREIIRSEIQMNLAVIHENVKSDSSSIKENSKK